MGVLNLISIVLLLSGSHAINVLKFNNLKPAVEDEKVMSTGNKWDILVMGSSELKNHKRQVTVSSEDIQISVSDFIPSDEKLSSIHNNKMRSIIDSVFKNIYSMVAKERPDLEDAVGDEPNHLSLTLDMFPCYRSILDKISKTCFSLPQNPYSLKWMTNFADLCVIDKQINQMVNKLVDVACADIKKINIKDVY